MDAMMMGMGPPGEGEACGRGEVKGEVEKRGGVPWWDSFECVGLQWLRVVALRGF